MASLWSRIVGGSLIAAAVFGASDALGAETPAAGLGPPNLSGVALEGPVMATGPQAYRFEHGHAWPALAFRPQQPLDWTRAGALAMQAENLDSMPVRLLLRVDDTLDANGDERSISAVTVLQPHIPTTLVLPLGRFVPPGMRAPPPWPVAAKPGEQIVSEQQGSVNLSHVRALYVSGFESDEDHVLRLGAPTLRDADPDASRPTALADAFGQWVGGAWPEKVRSLVDLRAKLRQADAALHRLAPVASADRWGGVSGGPSLQATGFFRTERVDGRWTFVTPQGHRFFSIGVDAVQTQSLTVVAGRLGLFQALPPEAIHAETYDFSVANLERGLGPDWRARWPAHALTRVQAWGFNTLGNWSEASVAGLGRMAHVASDDFEGDSALVPMINGRSVADPFDPRFAAVADQVAAVLTSHTQSDPSLLGYFSGNELPWAVDGRPETGLAAHVMGLGGDSPAKQAFVDALHNRYGSVAAWAALWGRSLAPSWEDAAVKPLSLPSPVPPAAREDIAAFEARFAEAYFRTVALAIKAHDPRHLYLGARFGTFTPGTVAACAHWCDVMSFNVYGMTPEERASAWRPFDKPVLIGEFQFGSTDRGLFWAGMVHVDREQNRGPAYAAYLDAALADPQIVGTHWFQYADEPLTGRPYDGENAHIGLVAVTDVPYPGLVAAIAAANRRALARFAGSGLAELRGTQGP